MSLSMLISYFLNIFVNLQLPNRSTQDVVERFYKWKATVMKQLQDNKQNKSKKKNSKKFVELC